MSTTTNGNVTANTTTATITTTTTVGDFRGSDNGPILAMLILIFLLLLAMPVVLYILARKFCWIKVHAGTGKWKIRPIPETRDRNKNTQTDVIGLELEEFYKRRQRTDMSKYIGKDLPETSEQIRWHRLDPKSWNDPWTTKHAGKETNYMNRVF